jgi:hypothetical protein
VFCGSDQDVVFLAIDVLAGWKELRRWAKGFGLRQTHARPDTGSEGPWTTVEHSAWIPRPTANDQGLLGKRWIGATFDVYRQMLDKQTCNDHGRPSS